MPPTSGTMINANVRLLDMLGQGGMGSVWLAEHLSLEAQVAVKFIDPTLIKREPSLRERFKREASICARLRSIHAVQTFDHGLMDDDTPYIVMELLEGDNLTARVEEDAPLSPREVAMLIAQVAKVLHRAHVLGIVHRDIKPDNIFLTQDSDYELFVKVLDFGIAKEQRPTKKREVTRTGMVVGTPEFMSPEQAIGSKAIDHRADLFSLGVVAYYALTGELPFDPESETAMWLQISQGNFTSVRAHLPHAPAELDAWFRHALQAKPAARFQSARIMARAFAIAVAGGGSGEADALSSSDDSLSLPAIPVEPMADASDDSWPDMRHLLRPKSDRPPTAETHVGGPHPGQLQPGQLQPRQPQHRAETEPATERMQSQPYSPAQSAVLGPGSAAHHGESQAQLSEAAQGSAEADEAAPTPRILPPPARPGVYDAVRAGAYNAGDSGAFNDVIAGRDHWQPSASGQPPALRQMLETLPPTSSRSKRRTVAVVALSIAVIGAVSLALLRLAMG